jgi:hypothetical protein
LDPGRRQQNAAMLSTLLCYLGNSLAPGSVLVLRGRLGPGLLLLLPGLVCLALLLLGAVLTGGPLWGSLLLGSLIAWLVLALVANLLLWQGSRRPKVDAAQAQELYERCARAWLTDRLDEALACARELCRRLPHLPGAWRLLARCAESAGAQPLAHKARRRAQSLLERDG